MSDRHLFVAAVALYGISAIYSILLFRRGFQRDDYINYGLLLAAFGFHTAAMFERGFSLSRCPINNLYEATLFTMWSMAGAYLFLGLWPRNRFLGAFAAPLLFAIGVFALMPGLDVQRHSIEMGSVWLSLHVALFALAYGAFGLSSVAALMYLTQEHDLKVHKLRAILALVPPIQRLERVGSSLLAIGFVLLTLALGVSFFGVVRQNVGSWMGDPKILWSLFVWLLYLGLVLARIWLTHGGRRFAWGLLGGFVFVVLTFPLFNLLSPLHNP